MIIEVDSHSHTVACGHAYSTLADNVKKASEKNLRLLAITEHGPAMPGSPHPWFFYNLRVIPRFFGKVGVLRGVEANIMDAAGTIDVPEDLKNQLDIVLGSLHEPVFSPATKNEHTKAVINAMQSGAIDVFAHGGNPSFPIDFQEVAAAAAACNVLVEINNSSFTTSRKGSEGNCSKLAQAVIKHGGYLTFGSDAHIDRRIGVFDECIAFAAENNIPPERILSTSAISFLRFLEQRGKTSVRDFLRSGLREN